MEVWRNSKGRQATWRPNPILLRVHLGVQEQPNVNWMPRPHPKSEFNNPYMDGKIISWSFYWRWFQVQSPSESLEIVRGSWHPDSVPVLRHRILAFGPCIFVEPIRGTSRGKPRPIPYISVAAAFIRIWVLL
jgi:hypothetical protein